MFGDGQWDEARTAAQERHLASWLQKVDGMRLVIVECGAGKAIPTVRRFCERLAHSVDATLVRINVREADVPDDHIGLSLGALEALQTIDEYLKIDRDT
jgi:hypothetical protein